MMTLVFAGRDLLLRESIIHEWRLGLDEQSIIKQGCSTASFDARH